MPNYLLTKKQREVYSFIKSYIEKNSHSPYIREIQEGCGIISYKGAIDKLVALERKGYIQRKLSKHRSIFISKNNIYTAEVAARRRRASRESGGDSSAVAKRGGL